MPGQYDNGIIRKRWRNYVDDQRSAPLKYFKPSSLQELREIVLDAEDRHYKVKAIGSGHSSSDIAICRDYMIDTHGLNKVLDKSMLSLKPGVDSDNLLLVEGGIRLADLIKILDQHDKALINMGAYTGQTLAGVISTSTHGSGRDLDAFPAYVAAIVLVGECGKLYHIERAGAASISTAPIRIDGYADIKFVCDDDHFKAIAVSMGCMGIIYAVILRVTPSYWLKEMREFSTWEKVKAELEQGQVLHDFRHLEVLVSPYMNRKKERTCLVTKRKLDYEKKKGPLIPRGHRKIIYELTLAVVPDFILDALMRGIINGIPKLIPWMAKLLLSSLTDRDYTDKSFKVLDLGKANNLSAYATEIAFPSDQYIAATEAILEIVRISVQEGEQYLSAPFSLRFVKINDLFLSMQYGTKENDFVCMIEFPTVSKTIGGIEMLARIESAMYAHGGIPHWGQVNHIGGAKKASVGRFYPRFDDWMNVYRTYCKIGTFQNDFTRRCGIEA